MWVTGGADPRWGIDMHTEDEIRALIAAEKREARQNAKALIEAAKSGDVERFARFAYPDDGLNIDWEMACRGIAKFNTVLPEIRDIFADLWTVWKMLPLRVGNRRVLAN